MIIFLVSAILLSASSCRTSKGDADASTKPSAEIESQAFVVNVYGDTLPKIQKTEEEWKKILTPHQYYVLREKGTERAFTGKLLENKKQGIYTCSACNTALFKSETKFDSGTGWPSFYDVLDKGMIKLDTDYDIGYARTEVMCGRCGGHLGHVFEDGPAPTGLRYCINSVSLNFVEALQREK